MNEEKAVGMQPMFTFKGLPIFKPMLGTTAAVLTMIGRAGAGRQIADALGAHGEGALDRIEKLIDGEQVEYRIPRSLYGEIIDLLARNAELALAVTSNLVATPKACAAASLDSAEIFRRIAEEWDDADVMEFWGLYIAQDHGRSMVKSILKAVKSDGEKQGPDAKAEPATEVLTEPAAEPAVEAVNE